MYSRVNAKRFASALRRSGERITVHLDRCNRTTKAVIQFTGKNFMRKYPDEKDVKRLGGVRPRSRIAFLPYFEEWDNCEKAIYISYRNKRYIVDADSVVCLGDEPVYIWAIMSEVATIKGGYYDDIS